MFFEIYSLFPEFYHSFFRTGIMHRAIGTGIIDYRVQNIREYGEGGYKSVDDYPFGGGPGMLLKYPVLKQILSSKSTSHLIYLTPRGKPLTQKRVGELAELDTISLLCGHYEGVDQRILDTYVDEEVSIGDYILSGGEAASLILIESVARKVEKVIGNKDSLEDESFEDGLLEYDQYTRPAQVDGLSVPDVLLSGNHSSIKKWSYQNALINTFKRRPDLLRQKELSEEDIVLLDAYITGKHHYLKRSKK
jgi:tRNA (guanine37-N1)-methyltransferase